MRTPFSSLDQKIKIPERCSPRLLPLPGQRDAQAQKCFRLTSAKGAGFNGAGGQPGPRPVDTGNSTQMIAS